MDGTNMTPERLAGMTIATLLFGATAFGLVVVAAASLGLFT